MVQILVGIILIALAIQSKLGKKILIGKRGNWLEEKDSAGTNAQQSGEGSSAKKATEK